MGDPGRAHHRLPRPGGPSPGAERARPGAGALTRRIRALPDGAMSTLTWDQGSEMARHQRQGRRHRDRACSFAHPHSPWERGTNENTNRHRGPLPAQRHPHHQPPTLPGRHRRRTGQLPPRHPRLPHPTRGIHPTHCHHPLDTNKYRNGRLRRRVCPDAATPIG